MDHNKQLGVNLARCCKGMERCPWGMQGHCRGWGGGSRGLLSLEEGEFRRTHSGPSRVPFLTLLPSPERNQRQGWQNQKQSRQKDCPTGSWLQGLLFIAQGNGYKYARKSNYDSANRMGQNLSLSSNHSRRDKHDFILNYQLELSTMVPDH